MENKLKILAVISSFSGGPGRILAEIVEYAPPDFEFAVIALADKSEASIIDVLKKEASFVGTFNKKSGIDYKTFIKFNKTLNRLSPQVAISFDFASNIYTCAALRGRKIPWIASVYGLESAFVLWRRWVERVAFVLARRVATDSFAVKNKLVRHRIIPLRKIKVIPNGTLLQTNHRKMGFGFGLKTIGCAANFYSEIKGHRYAIEALKYLPSDFRLVMVGDGILKDRMMNHAENIGVKNRISFLGHKLHGEVLNEMRKMDVLVIPSLSEGFGLVAIEAMSVGLPVVASCVGGLASVVDDGVTGRLVPSGDPEVLADAVNYILDDNDRYISMQKACIKRVKERYSVEAMTNKYFELFDKVLL